MQQNEFNNLMDGRPAKWAELFTPNLPENKSLKDNPLFSLTFIQDNEVLVPENIRQDVYKFVQEERGKGENERAIRRAVKKKWNIFVV